MILKNLCIKYHRYKNNSIICSDRFLNDLFYYFICMDVFPNVCVSMNNEHRVLQRLQNGIGYTGTGVKNSC